MKACRGRVKRSNGACIVISPPWLLHDCLLRWGWGLVVSTSCMGGAAAVRCLLSGLCTSINLVLVHCDVLDRDVHPARRRPCVCRRDATV